MQNMVCHSYMYKMCSFVTLSWVTNMTMVQSKHVTSCPPWPVASSPHLYLGTNEVCVSHQTWELSPHASSSFCIGVEKCELLMYKIFIGLLIVELFWQFYSVYVRFFLGKQETRIKRQRTHIIGPINAIQNKLSTTIDLVAHHSP